MARDSLAARTREAATKRDTLLAHYRNFGVRVRSRLLSLASFVGRSPWTAADALVGSLRLYEGHFVTEERVQGDPRRPGGLPHGYADIRLR
jgi:hypothetical protein